jgi:CheY-like chemotaxis protein
MNAGDGQEAVDAAINNPDIDIILMDIQLPVLDGYSALIKIREVRKDMVVIAQTAYGLLGDKEKILNAGFDDYIIKPILSQNLIDKLVVNLKKK